MNDSERAKVADEIETELDAYCQSPFNGAFAVSLMQIIDRLLADRDAAVTPRESVRKVRAALDRIHDKYERPVSLAFDLTDDDVGVIATIRTDTRAVAQATTTQEGTSNE